MDYAKKSLGYCTAIFWRILALSKVYPIVLETGQDFNHGLISFNTEILKQFSVDFVLSNDLHNLQTTKKTNKNTR